MITNDMGNVVQCPKCEYLVIEEEMTACIDAKTNELLSYLCDDCVKEWLEYEKELEE
jgi:DNA-directed RNA polymerase subunit RPC12/RpoP|tara:strand:- start:73 stop:243 length:171 start_codon:yes stop_codon:yes gene_type:complete